MEPQRNADERRLNAVTEVIIAAVFQVANTLGVGFLEKVYENALKFELEDRGFGVLQQHPIPVFYAGRQVGDYVADLLVEGSVIIEVKAVKACDDVHRAQCINYLRATGLRVCLLVNFAKSKVEMKRIVHNL